MDNHTVRVTLEYHAMAETPNEAIKRVLETLSFNVDPQDLLFPICMSIDVDTEYSNIK